jgi:hypothetical protein
MSHHKVRIQSISYQKESSFSLASKGEIDVCACVRNKVKLSLKGDRNMFFSFSFSFSFFQLN